MESAWMIGSSSTFRKRSVSSSDSALRIAERSSANSLRPCSTSSSWQLRRQKALSFSAHALKKAFSCSPFVDSSFLSAASVLVRVRVGVGERVRVRVRVRVRGRVRARVWVLRLRAEG
jgi:hypothetical protein